MDFEDIVTLIEKLFSQWGVVIIFFGSLLETSPLGWLIPGGAILLIAGYFGNTIQLPLIPIIIWGSLGTWFAFILSYILGRKTGMWLVEKLHQEKNALLAKHLLKKHGGIILTTSLLSNLTRFWVSYVAGVEKYSFYKFNLSAIISSISWVTLLVFLGYFAGYELENLKRISNQAGVIAWGFLILSITIIFVAIKIESGKIHDTLSENH